MNNNGVLKIPSSTAAISKVREIPKMEEHQKDLMALVKFRNSVRDYLVLALLVTFALSVFYGVFAFLKLFLRFFSPFLVAITYSVLTGVFSVVGVLLVYALYYWQSTTFASKIFSSKDHKMFLESVWDYYEPGCLYDCRVSENRRDVNSLMSTLFFVYIFANALYWLNASQHETPSFATPEGMRFAVTMVVLMVLETLRMYAIITSLWAFYNKAIAVPETIRPA